MIAIGANVHYTMKITCPVCGQTANNRFPPASAFIGMNCDNQECLLYARIVIVEKSTSIVISTDPPLYAQFVGEKWEPLFPVLANREGEKQWPKKN